jgi:hypothetical protein
VRPFSDPPQFISRQDCASHDAFAIFNILSIFDLNSFGQERKNYLVCFYATQYPIIFED